MLWLAEFSDALLCNGKSVWEGLYCENIGLRAAWYPVLCWMHMHNISGELLHVCSLRKFRFRQALFGQKIVVLRNSFMHWRVWYQLYRICCSKEAAFCLSGTVSRHIYYVQGGGMLWKLLNIHQWPTHEGCDEKCYWSFHFWGTYGERIKVHNCYGDYCSLAHLCRNSNQFTWCCTTTLLIVFLPFQTGSFMKKGPSSLAPDFPYLTP
jgi:hypothetical protein